MNLRLHIKQKVDEFALPSSVCLVPRLPSRWRGVNRDIHRIMIPAHFLHLYFDTECIHSSDYVHKTDVHLG